MLWNPKRGWVKAQQVARLAERAAALSGAGGADSGGGAGGGGAAVVLLGDYNCAPFSPLHSFLCRGYAGRLGATPSRADPRSPSATLTPSGPVIMIGTAGSAPT